MSRRLFSTTILLSSILSSFSQNTIETDTLQSNYLLNTVVVSGTLTARTLKNTPVLTKVISGNDIRESGASTVLEALENFVPGVIFTPNAMGDNIQIAGLDNKYILILSDGERLVNERTENVNFSRLNVSDIKQIEIINGASSVLYGSNAIGAVINIISKDVAEPLTGSARARYSKYNTCVGDASVGFKINDFSSKTVFSAKNSDGYKLSSDASNYLLDPYSDYTVSQVFKYKPNEQWNIELKGTYYNNETWLIHKNQSRIDEDYTWGGKIQSTAFAKHVLTLSSNSDRYDEHLIFKLRNDSSTRANGSQYSTFRSLDAWNVTEKLQVVSGAELNLEGTFSYNQFGFDPGDKDASNWNLFTQADFKTETGLEALVGARYTNHSQFGAYLSPKISLMYRLDDFRFRGSISNGFKAPTLKEMYMNFPHRIGEDIPFYVIGNPDLVPEESWYKSLSAEYIGNKINASLTVHQNAIKNKINTIQQWNEAQNRTEMLYENVEDAKITGIDLSFQWTFLKHFHLRGGYSYADAIDKDTRLQLYGNSKHTGTMSLIFKQRHLPLFSSLESPYTLSLSGRVMSPRIFSTKNEETGIITDESTGNYFISNFVYSQQFPIYNNWKGDLQFGINNLLNYTNRDFLSNNPGRLYFVSIGVKF